MTSSRILWAVEVVTGVSTKKMTARVRGRSPRKTAEAKFLAAHLMFTFNPSWTYAMIGRILGGMDHSSVIYALKRHDALMDTDPVYCDAAMACGKTLLEEEGDGSAVSFAPGLPELQITINVMSPPTRTETGAGRMIPFDP